MGFKFDILGKNNNKKKDNMVQKRRPVVVQKTQEQETAQQQTVAQPVVNQITPEEIRNIVSREVNAASLKNQLVEYMGSIEMRATKTEAMIGELKESLNEGLGRINIDRTERMLMDVRDTLKEGIEKIGTDKTERACFWN